MKKTAVGVVVLVIGVVSVIWLRQPARQPVGVGGAATFGSSQSPPSVRAIRQDITAVLTVDAVLRATPHFTVRASTAGVVHHLLAGHQGDAVNGEVPMTVEGGGVTINPIASNFVSWLVPEGAAVAAGVPVAEMMYGGFGAAAQMPPEAAYRLFSNNLSARAEILNGPGPFDCSVLLSPGDPSLPMSSSTGASGPGPGPAFICAIPLNVKAVEGLRATVGIKSAQRRNVVALPVGAVAGSAQMGEVSLVDSRGKVTTREVDLGVTDGAMVEIRSGLAAGDLVSATPPDLLHEAAP